MAIYIDDVLTAVHYISNKTKILMIVPVVAKLQLNEELNLMISTYIVVSKKNGRFWQKDY